jgi:integrase
MGWNMGQPVRRMDDMARTIGRLSAVKVQSLKQAGYHADGGNLYFRVAEGGTRGWIFRFAMHGRTRDMGLGPYPDVTLAKARTLATECRRLVADGFDPIERRKEERAAARVETAKAITFDDCARAYIAAHEAAWRNAKHRAQWTSTLATYVTPIFGKLPVHAVDTGFVMRVLEPIWSTKPETASRVRGRIESILDWARVRGYRTGENPARWRGHLDHLLPAKSKVRKVEHHAALPYAQVGDFMASLRQQPGIAARALEYLILIATRTGETLGALWDEIDLDAKVWTVPAARMKSGKEHRVPLSGAANSVLKEMRKIRHSDYVFPGARQGRPLSEMSLLMLLRRMGFGDITAHGFRSSFRDWAAERTTFAREVAEMALAHAIPDAVEAAYRRGDLFDKRRKLMDAWAGYCGNIEIDGVGKLVSLAHRKSNNR